MTQLAVGEGTLEDAMFSGTGLLLNVPIGKGSDKNFGALSLTARNKNAFRDVTTGQFSKKSKRIMGQNVNAAAGITKNRGLSKTQQVINEE